MAVCLSSLSPSRSHHRSLNLSTFLVHPHRFNERHVAHFGIDIDNRTICVYHGFNFGMCSGRMLCVLKVK